MQAGTERRRIRPPVADGGSSRRSLQVRGGWTERVALYARTVRHLRWEQVVFRPVRRLQRYLPLPTPAEANLDTGAVERLGEILRVHGPADEASSLARAAAVQRGEFRFLNHAETIARIDWSRRYVSQLWNYNLHYFDYAVDLAWAHLREGRTGYAERFVELCDQWIAATSTGRGDGWDPYPVSLRVVNWIQAIALFGESLPPAAVDRLQESLRRQLGFLDRRLERHVLANHLQKNLKALVVAGATCVGPAAERWRSGSAALLWEELFEQTLPDGGHFERSPMYHVLFLVDYLEVAALLGAVGREVPPAALERVGRMADALGVLSRPDGSLHLFNDAAAGIAPRTGWVRELAREVLGRDPAPAAGVLELPATGYFGWRDPNDRLRLVIDCGEPAAPYQPAHAHCDMLSFELDVLGHPVVVDAGVRGYEGDPLREYARSTRAHNTVAIGEREQTEVWGTFRVARRARPGPATHGRTEEGYRFSGSATPYHDRGAVHSRQVKVEGACVVTVVDRVNGAVGARLRSWLHFHPDLVLTAQSASRFLVAGDGITLRLELFGCEDAEIVRGESAPAQGWYCPEFGKAVPSPTLQMTVNRNDGREFGYSIRHAEEVA